ncbi:YbhB/YbcL family Raf kinase inhibitor-like protein [Chloroflexota bacterium]
MLKQATLIVFAMLLATVLASCGTGPSPTLEAVAATSEPPPATLAPATPTQPPPTATPQPAEATEPPPTPSVPPSTPTSPPPEPTETAPAPTLPPSTATDPPPPPTPTEEAPAPEPTAVLAMDSATFRPGGAIMVKHSCFGDNLSPPINWQGVPQGTQSLALTVVDPDSQPPGFVHWVIYNMPPSTSYLPEGVPPDAELWDGSLQGKNDFADYPGGDFPGGAPINQMGYDGPCPGNEHRYVFALYALDALLELGANATLGQLQGSMAGHVLGQAELVGLFAPP